MNQYQSSILAQLHAAQGDPQALTLATLNIVLEARGPQLRLDKDAPEQP